MLSDNVYKGHDFAQTLQWKKKKKKIEEKIFTEVILKKKRCAGKSQFIVQWTKKRALSGRKRENGNMLTLCCHILFSLSINVSIMLTS